MFVTLTGVFSKALIDGESRHPVSCDEEGFWSNVYNNVLSAVATPLRAVASNAAVLMEQGLHHCWCNDDW